MKPTKPTTNPLPRFAFRLRRLAVAAVLAGAGLAQAGLVNEWRGDDYTSGNWVDHLGSVAAPVTGTPLPVPAAFNTHAGVNMNGGYFAVPAGTAPAGLSNFTVVVVIKPDAPGPVQGGYWAATPLIGFDIGGGGQTDWGIAWGGDTGKKIVDGVGAQNLAGTAADSLGATPGLALNAVHAMALQVNATAGTIVTYVDGSMVVSNKAITVIGRSATNTAFVGGGMGQGTFVGQYAAIQIYDDGTTNCVALTQSLTNTYATPAPITLPTSAGADVGKSAAVTVSIPVSASASAAYTVTLTSDNTAVVANTTVNFPKGTIIQTANLPILALGVARVTATGPGLASSQVRVAGLNESALANQWLADTFNTGDPAWTDGIGGVAATAMGVEQAVPAAFGSTHKGVTRNGGNFTIPSTTAPCGMSNFTVAVVIKPTAVGNTGGAYYNGKYIIGFDIGGGGQPDWGMSWGGSSPAAGQRVVVGVGRGGGDSGIQSSAEPLALNQTHAAAMQVNNVAGTQTLWVDGVQINVNGGLTMLAMDTRNYQMLFDYNGLCAEVRLYTNSSVDGAGLTALLQNTYAGIPPVSLAASAPRFVDPGSTVNLTVSVPPSVTLASTLPVTITSDNPSVTGSTNVTLAIGATSTNVAVPILAAGSANLVATATGLTDSGAITIGGLGPRTLVEAFRASSSTSLNYGAPPSNGDAVTAWAGDTNAAAIATLTGVVNPTYHAGATLAGTPAIAFAGNSTLTLGADPSINPVSGRTNFSFAIVYKGSGTGGSGAPWYQQSGLADAEAPGVVDDWGTSLNGAGEFSLGLGNPDVTMAQAGYNTSDSLFHAAVGAYDVLNGQMRLIVDDKSMTTNTFVISSEPRGNYVIRFTDNSFNGEVAEMRFYDGALTQSEMTNLINTFQTTYNLMWPDKSLCSIMAPVSGGMTGDDIPVTVSIPVGFNAAGSVSIKVTNSNTSAVTLTGGNPMTLTFAAGATNAQTFLAHLAGVGSATLTASGAGLLSGTLTLTTLPAATLVEAFRASSLTNQVPGIANGDAVYSWAGDMNPSAVMNQNSSVSPTFRTNATPSGAPSVVFDGTNSTALIILGPVSPVAGLNNFSFAVVFKAAATGTGTGQWYNMPAIIDGEEPGAAQDWGIALDQSGQINFGVGNPDFTLLDPHNVVSSTAYHVAVMTCYSSQQKVEVVVDANPATVSLPGANIGVAARDASPVYVGRSFGNKFFTGELVEWDIYNGALTPAQATNLAMTLRTQYGIVVPSDLQLTIAAAPANKVTITWPSIASANGYRLQSSLSLSTGWGDAGLSVTTVGNQSVASDSIAGGAKFYRLYHP